MNELADLIARAARAHGERPAVIGGDATLSFAAADGMSNRLASAMGLAKGERVAVLLPNSANYVVIDFALLKAGLIRVPVNTRLAAPEIEYILNNSGAALLFVGAEHVGAVAAMRPRLSALRHLVFVGDGAAPAGMTPLAEVLAAGRPEPFAVPAAGADGYMLGYTSGTTGRPKGALTTFGSRKAALLHMLANEVAIEPGDAMLHVASLSHGTGTKVLPHFAKGAVNVLLPRFTPEAFFAAIQRHRVTTTWMVPTMVAMLADAPLRARFDLTSLKTIMYAGAPMPEAVMRRALAAFGPVFIQIYGLNEATQPDLVMTKADHALDPQTGGVRYPNATGRRCIGVTVRLVDDAGRDVAVGEIGEIIIAGEHIMQGYWNDPEATAETLREGWCHTGDLAREDESGMIAIVDRKKEMIISGGYNVYPREVEDALYRLAAVGECAVVGLPDPLWGESVQAVVALKAGQAADADAITRHCAEWLANYKKPRGITFVAELPKTAFGKIDKKAVRAMLAAAPTELRGHNT